MGAAGSVVLRNSENDTLVKETDQNDASKNESDPKNPNNSSSTTIPTQDPVPPTKAPAKEKENMRSKFPSMTVTKQAEPKQKKTEKTEKTDDNGATSPAIFKIEIAVNIPCLQFLKVSSVLLLRVSIESLDLIREGSESLVIQFPYQNISSWGSSPSAFQFSVFNYGNKFEVRDGAGGGGGKTGGVGGVSAEGGVGAGVGGGGSGGAGGPRDDVKEEKDSDTKNVSSSQSDETFREKFGKSTSKDNLSFTKEDGDDTEDIIIVLKTAQALLIERATMTAVQRLMADIEKSAVSKVDFDQLLIDVYNPQLNELKPNWEEIISGYSATKFFLAKQAMDLMVFVHPIAPFEKYDLACLLYKKILNKTSFQLVVNTFEDVRDRENLIHRLKLECKENKDNRDSRDKDNENGIGNGREKENGVSGLVSDCSMILAQTNGCVVVPLIR